MSTSSVLSLVDFTAYELPTKKWMKMVRPRVRLRVRVQNREFVSSAVTLRDRSPDDASIPDVCWPWSDDRHFSRPSFTDAEVFEVEIERRFLLWYRCIRRTKPVTIDQVRTGNHCALSLYDGRQPVEMLEDRIEIGEIMFSVRSDATGDDASSQGKVSPTAYA